MKFSTPGVLLLVAMLANGCSLFHHRKQPTPPAPASAYLAPATPSTTLNPIVTPDNSLTARVATYNAAGRFVVLSFPVGRMPNMDQTLFLYRNGLKVARFWRRWF